jgi:hypothetical protein
LPPTTQLVFFYDRLRGRFHYGGHRLYAVKSLGRLGPYLAAFVLVTVLGVYEMERRSEERIQTAAVDILNKLEFRDHNVSETEAEALLRLASAEEPVRHLVLTLVLTDPDRARVFDREPETIIRAVAGVSPRFRALAASALANATASFSSNLPETTRAIADAARLLGRPEAVSVGWWMAAIKGTRNPDALKALGAGLGPLASKLTDSQAREVVEPFLLAVKSTPDARALQTVGAGLRALTAKFTDSQAKEVVESFLAAIKSSTNPDALSALGTGLGALPAKLTDEQAREAVEPFLAAIKSTLVSNAIEAVALQSLGVGLAALPGKLTDSQAREAIEASLAAIKNITRTSTTAMESSWAPTGLQTVVWGLQGFSAKFTERQVADAFELFLAAVQSTTNPDALQAALGPGLRALTDKLTDSKVY